MPPPPCQFAAWPCLPLLSALARARGGHSPVQSSWVFQSVVVCFLSVVVMCVRLRAALSRASAVVTPQHSLLQGVLWRPPRRSPAVRVCAGQRPAGPQKSKAKDNTSLASTRACLLKTCLQEAPPSVEVQFVPESHVWRAAAPSVVLQVPPPDLVLGERAAALEVLGVQFAPLFR